MSYCEWVTAEAPAKVNLTLDITGTTSDGYHRMEMVMHAVGLCDTVTVRRQPGERIAISSTDPAVPVGESNIVHRAALRFFTATGLPQQGLAIHIDKRIPMQAGLAGGSADAAGTLRALDRLFETDLPDDALCAAGLPCGADVPFCIVGGCRLAQGIGEVLTPLRPLQDGAFVIAKPPEGMSTADAFGRFDAHQGLIEHPDTAAVRHAVNRGDLHAVGAGMVNVFEQVCFPGSARRIKNHMLGEGALGAVMTGSGTAVVGLFHSEKTANHCLSTAKELAESIFVARPLPYGARVVRTG